MYSSPFPLLTRPRPKKPAGRQDASTEEWRTATSPHTPGRRPPLTTRRAERRRNDQGSGFSEK